MSTSRLEAFSDGVLAIVLTIMVLGLHRPEGTSLSAFVHGTGPGLLTYLLSFVYVGIYWNNHHHMFQITETVDGSVLWSNLAWMFSISLLPFTTEWMAASEFARVPVIVYGVDLLLTAVVYFVLQHRIMRAQGPDSPLRRAIGNDTKGKVSSALYLAGILAAVIDRSDGVWGAANVGAIAALACFVVVAAIWVVPDRRIVRAVNSAG